MVQYINVYHIGNLFFCEHRGWSRQLKAKSLMEADREVRSNWKGSEPIKVILVTTDYNDSL